MTRAAMLQKTAAHLQLVASDNPAFSDGPLDGQQLSAIYAVIAYVARGLSLKAEVVQSLAESEFKVKTIASLQRRDFARAVEFLLDLHMNELRSRR